MIIKKIGVLDFGIRPTCLSRNEICISAIQEATLVDKLGFSRVWYAEHYGSKLRGWASADMIVALAAAYTSNINVGIAGSLIRYYQPLKVAMDYKLLSRIFPNRIDLGFSKSSASANFDSVFNRFGSDHNEIETSLLIKEKIELSVDLINKVDFDTQEDLLIFPSVENKPFVWNLVSSSKGYEQSLNFGTNCCRTLLHLGAELDPGLNELENYKGKFFKKFGFYPLVNIAIAGSCQNRKSDVSQILEYLKSTSFYSINYDSTILGSPKEVHHQLSVIAEKYGVDEIIFLELGIDDKQRRQSFRNLSRIFELNNINTSK
ncbi:LLM class flavin-dependent oxidoreductase [Mucilaginibacter sp. E4BP6]|uniref:LLM class flavin-dependent oxidoreductase n=1 Tax=Mucilaginibacter sp. E4BP6 TaxID=2723089 RepID=UPI0015C8FE42|nr:LLM class flavin-dependent oxidoreductase [Mucilaginibacter sp. E4BP6]NYE68154.1 hypothetical protein [Mucilaginibacter sp. E4BP6]